MTDPKDLPPHAPAQRSDPAIHATRRVGGARVNISKRVLVHAEVILIEGWAINLSRGGMRLVLEQPVDVDDIIDIAMGEVDGNPVPADDAPRRSARVVWVKRDEEGCIVGVEFTEPGPSSQTLHALAGDEAAPSTEKFAAAGPPAATGSDVPSGEEF